MPHLIHKSAIANSLVEYVLPVGLIAITVFVAMTQLTPGLFNYAKASNNLVEQSAATPQMQVRAMGANPYGKTLEVTMADGTVLTLSDYPSDLAKMIETVGGDGTTDILIANLLSLAEQMYQAEKLTEAQYNQLQDMANKAHRLGQMEGLLERAARETSNPDDFFGKPLEFEGKQYTSESLSLLIAQTAAVGDHAIPGVNIDPETRKLFNLELNESKGDGGKPYSYGKDLMLFIDSYMAANRNGALNDPAVKAVVFDLSQTIQLLSMSTAHTAHGVKNRLISKETFDKAVASKTSHEKAVNICRTGNGTDSGENCQG